MESVQTGVQKRRLQLVDPHTAHPVTLISGKAVAQGDAVSQSTVERKVAAGVQVPAIKIGPRCKRWVASEVVAVRRARIAGATDEQLREIVQALVLARGSV